MPKIEVADNAKGLIPFNDYYDFKSGKDQIEQGNKTSWRDPAVDASFPWIC
jgi:hypothetical protein